MKTLFLSLVIFTSTLCAKTITIHKSFTWGISELKQFEDSCNKMGNNIKYYAYNIKINQDGNRDLFHVEFDVDHEINI